jgi:hypothetical protein
MNCTGAYSLVWVTWRLIQNFRVYTQCHLSKPQNVLFFEDTAPIRIAGFYTEKIHLTVDSDGSLLKKQNKLFNFKY